MKADTMEETAVADCAAINTFTVTKLSPSAITQSYFSGLYDKGYLTTVKRFDEGVTASE